MNILVVNDNSFSYLGGVEFHILNLARELLKRSHSVTLVCRANREPKDVESGIRVVSVNNLLALRRFISSEASDFDVCHAHMSRKLFSAVGLISARHAGLRTVFTPHCFYPAHGRLGSAMKWLYDRTFSYWSFRSSDAVINLTERDREDSIERGMARVKSTLIPNSISLAKLWSVDPIDFAAQQGIRRPYLLHVGRFQKHKCISFLVDRIREIEGLDLVLIGQDDGEIKAISEQIARLDVKERVHIVMKSGFRELCSAYRQATALVMASTNEGLPTVVLEAMAFSLPVVAPNVGGIPWIIEPGRTGFLYRWGDSASFCAALAQALQRRNEITANALREVQARFSWEANAGRIEQLYAGLVSSRRNRPLAPDQELTTGDEKVALTQFTVPQ